MRTSFPYYTQLDAMDCGPTCLRMIAKHYGRSYTLQNLRERSFITREGVSMLGISDAAESIGMHTQGVRITLEQLMTDVPLPCILHWNQNHFVVLYKVHGARYTVHDIWQKVKNQLFGKPNNSQLFIADPAGQKYVMNREEFCRCWLSSKSEGKETGIALLLEPTPDFYEYEDDKEKREKNLVHFFRYLFPYKSQIFQLIVGLLIGSVLALISDFLAKLMKLPIRFFDAKNIGDIMQRIGDHSRIQGFMTGTTLTTLFSFFNFFIFAFILAYYNLSILLVFLAGNILYISWILFFMRYRRQLDYKRFTQSSPTRAIWCSW